MNKILFFLAVNVLGFLSVGICFAIGMITHMVDFSAPGFSAGNFQTHFVMGTIMVWLSCAVLSTAWFFLKGKAGLVFLWAPVFVPLLYGLSTLYRLSL